MDNVAIVSAKIVFFMFFYLFLINKKVLTWRVLIDIVGYPWILLLATSMSNLYLFFVLSSCTSADFDKNSSTVPTKQPRVTISPSLPLNTVSVPFSEPTLLAKKIILRSEITAQDLARLY